MMTSAVSACVQQRRGIGRVVGEHRGGRRCGRREDDGVEQQVVPLGAGSFVDHHRELSNGHRV